MYTLNLNSLRSTHPLARARAVVATLLAAGTLLGTSVLEQPTGAQAATPASHAPSSATLTKQERFFQTYAADAVASREATGVPASVVLAQAALESAWGESRLTTRAFNFFGVKATTKQGDAGAVYMPTREVIGGKSVMKNEPFRAYTSAAASFTDHGLFFVENKRYAAAMANREDARAFSREVQKAGYATDPQYAAKLIQIMDRYDLYRFDA